MRTLSPGDIVANLNLESVQSMPVPVPHPILLTHIQFRRFAGCPMCNLHLRTFVQRSVELQMGGIQEVAVFHSSAQDLRTHGETPFAVIADPEKTLYKAFGVEKSVRALLHPRAWSAALKGMRQHGVRLPGSGESPLGLPADFLIDTAGRVLACRYGQHAFDQWDVDEVLDLAARWR